MNEDEEILRMVKSGEYVLFPAAMDEAVYKVFNTEILESVGNETSEMIFNILASVWGMATGTAYLYDAKTDKFFPHKMGCAHHPINLRYAKDRFPDFLKHKLSTKAEIEKLREEIKPRKRKNPPKE